jgi:hypothetical protein
VLCTRLVPDVLRIKDTELVDGNQVFDLGSLLLDAG